MKRLIRDTLSLGSVDRSDAGDASGLLPSQIVLQVESDATPALVEIGHDRLEQVLMHLVANARDAMPEGGRVNICGSSSHRRGASR